MADEQPEELVLTPPQTGLEKRRRTQPTLVTVGKGLRTSDGRFHPHLAADYVRDRAEKWITVTELSKVFATNTLDGQKRVRRNMPAVFTETLSHGDFLLYDQGHRGRIVAVKVMDPRNDDERKRALPQVERMRKRNELTAEKYKRALELLAEPPQS